MEEEKGFGTFEEREKFLNSFKCCVSVCVSLRSTYSKLVLRIKLVIAKAKLFRRIGNQGRVVRKPVNANPGLKVNRSINFSCIKMVFASYFLFSLRLFKFKREGQKYKQKNSPKSC